MVAEGLEGREGTPGGRARREQKLAEGSRGAVED